jgi:hypothetical protein
MSERCERRTGEERLWSPVGTPRSLREFSKRRRTGIEPAWEFSPRTDLEDSRVAVRDRLAAVMLLSSKITVLTVL